MSKRTAVLVLTSVYLMISVLFSFITHKNTFTFL